MRASRKKKQLNHWIDFWGEKNGQMRDLQQFKARLTAVAWLFKEESFSIPFLPLITPGKF